MLITRVGAFAEYQEKEAWTWEHQALLHARAWRAIARCAPSSSACASMCSMRCVRRDTLRAEVRNMRERMRKELSNARPESGKFDIKQDAGGTADIEFLAQYWALLHAGTHPPVVMFADTIRQLESVASADLVPQETVDVLTHAYRKYRERAHHLSLEQAEAVVPAEEFADDRAAVTAIWNATMGETASAIAYNPRPCQPPNRSSSPTRRTNTKWTRAICRSRARCRRCISGTRTRASICRSSRPAGRSARTAAPSTVSRLTPTSERRRSDGVRNQPKGLSSDGGGVENQIGFSAPMWKQSSSRMPNLPGR